MDGKNKSQGDYQKAVEIVESANWAVEEAKKIYKEADDAIRRIKRNEMSNKKNLSDIVRRLNLLEFFTLGNAVAIILIEIKVLHLIANL